MKSELRLGLSFVSAISLYAACPGFALAAWPDSWSCSDNTCTGTYANTSGGGYSVGIPFWNLSPSTALQSTTVEIGEFEPNAENCDIDHEAVQAGIEIKRRINTDGIPNNTQDQTEYGAILGDKGLGVETGIVVQGQSYNQADPPATNLTPSRDSIGATNAQIVGIIHSHPYDSDPAVRTKNRRPSDNDWALADQLVSQGADSSRLTLYIIDDLGVLRAYSYVPPSQRSGTNPPARPVSTACE